MFDVMQFLESNNIEHTDTGSGVKKGNVLIHCPFCGDSAKGDYMGVRLRDGTWGCWKDKAHRGKRPAFLVAKLLGISFKDALEITGGRELAAVNEDDLDNLIDGDFFNSNKDSEINTNRSLILDEDFIPMWGANKYSIEKFLDYLYYDRGIKEPEKVCKYYSLYYSIKGRCSNRIIIPVYYKGILVTWTSRSIFAEATLRYLTLSSEEESLNIKKTLYNYDRADRNGNILFLVEGPFDAINFDWNIKAEKCRVVALSSLTLEEEQLYSLYDLSIGYKKVVVMLDKGEVSSAIALVSMLDGFLNCEVTEGDLPRGVKDPGELTVKQCNKILTAELGVMR